MIFRPFKKIKELQDEIYALRVENDALSERAERWSRVAEEEEEKKHNCGIWCDGCENFTKYEFGGVGGVYTYCKLDYECEDRKDGK